MDQAPASLTGLIHDLSVKAMALLRVELAIMASEISGKRDMALRALAWLLSGVVLGTGALALLLVAMLLAMVRLGLSPLMATTTLGLALALMAFLVILRALALLRHCNLHLERTGAEISKDLDLLAGRPTHV